MSKRTRRKLLLISGGATLSLTLALMFVHFGDRLPVHFSAHPAFALSADRGSVADVVDRVLPSVVNIASTRKVEPSKSPFFDHPMFRDYFRRRSPRMQRGLGSGVIVSSDGVIITNNHVVAKADKIRVTLWDKREFSAKVVGTDPKSDLAVLKLKGAKNLRSIVLGDSDRLRLGDAVLAVGNPFGVGQTVTLGIVSAKGRANIGIVDYEDFIQTDAAINPGNSGGALVSMRGELIGINTAILSRSGGYQGIGFAIPTNMVKPIMKSLLSGGKVLRGWLGVVIQDLTHELAKAMKLPPGKGVLVSDVDPRGPAKKAGLRRGDLLLKVNGKEVNTTGRLRNLVASAGAAATVRLELQRDGKRRSLSVKLASLPGNLGGRGPAQVAPTESQGLGLAPLSPKVRERYKISRRVRQGVVVTQVAPGSVGDRAGLQPGDVILEVNRVKIGSVSRFSQLFAAARGQVLLLVYRRGVSQYLLIHK